MARPPSVETLGYCPSSLRDGLRAALANPAGSRLQTCDTADYKSALRPRGIGVLARHRVWLALAVGGLPAFHSLAIHAAEQTNSTTLRDEWVDADTGHRVVRLSRVPGTSESFYFHQNACTAEGDKMVFVNRAPGGRDRLFVLDLATRQSEPLTEPGVRGGVVGRASRRVYYQREGALYATHLDTHETKLIAHLPARWSVATINADETLAAGTFTEPGGEPVDTSGPKSAWFDKVFEAKRTLDLFTVELATGRTNAFYRKQAWLNHVQFSPTDPGLLMFCHEGPWHKVDRIWLIRTDASGLRLMHRRTVPMEIAGHEFWSPDGKRAWFDLQVPRAEKFFLAGVDVATGQETRYPLARDEWSVHYNVSHDGRLFAGDGGARNMVAHAADGKWIRLFTAQPDGTLRSERLVNMARHDYSLEPNVNFTPDGKWIVFRGNFDGSAQVYAVEVAAADYAIGADVSFLKQAEDRGTAFRDNGDPKPGLQIFKDHGYNWVRLRLFHTPTRLPNNREYTIALAKDAKRLGFKFLLDFHYSDTWADPAKQFIPKAWEGKSHAELVQAVFEYTRDTIAAFRQAGVLPDMVQPGNEIIHGMLWPDGKLPDHWDNFAELVKAGIRGVEAGRGDGPRPRIMIHIDRGGDVKATRWFFDKLNSYGVQYDVIGQSYYPWWHGSLLDLRENLNFMAETYTNDIIVVETAYNWRPAEYRNKPAPFPETPEGQREFLEEVNRLVLATPHQRGKGVFWWEPAVSMGPRSRGMFDNETNALPVITVFDKWSRR